MTRERTDDPAGSNQINVVRILADYDVVRSFESRHLGQLAGGARRHSPLLFGTEGDRPVTGSRRHRSLLDSQHQMKWRALHTVNASRSRGLVETQQ